MKAFLSILPFCLILTNGVSIASLPDRSLEKTAVKVTPIQKTILLDIGPSKVFRIFFGVCFATILITWPIFLFLVIKKSSDIIFMVIPTLWFTFLAVLTFALMLEDARIKCTPKGLILAAKCDMDNFSFFEILKFKTRYLPLIPYREIVYVDLAKVDLNGMQHEMIRIQKRSGEWYHINLIWLSKKDFLTLCNIIRQQSPEVQIHRK